MPGGAQSAYHFLECLGSGGFGTVYRAELRSAGDFAKIVAIKMLNPSEHTEGEFGARLRDEARVLGLLRHRVIVSVHNLERFDGRWAVVMEYVDGADVRALIDPGPLPAHVAAEIGAEVAAGLHAAFSHEGPDGRPLGLLHRDVKPSNIRVTKHGEVKLLDFGIARADFGAREARTRNMKFGSRVYMAPERLSIVERIDRHEGDVYSLGCVLFEMLVGQPFGPAAIVAASHAEKVIVAERGLRTTVQDERLVRAVLACLSFDPDERPSARTLWGQLRSISSESGAEPLMTWAERAVPACVEPTPPGELNGAVFGTAAGDHANPSDTQWIRDLGASPLSAPDPALQSPTRRLRPGDLPGAMGRPADHRAARAAASPRRRWAATIGRRGPAGAAVLVGVAVGLSVAFIVVAGASGAAWLALRSGAAVDPPVAAGSHEVGVDSDAPIEADPTPVPVGIAVDAVASAPVEPPLPAAPTPTPTVRTAPTPPRAAPEPPPQPATAPGVAPPSPPTPPDMDASSGARITLDKRGDADVRVLLLSESGKTYTVTDSGERTIPAGEYTVHVVVNGGPALRESRPLVVGPLDDVVLACTLSEKKGGWRASCSPRP